MVYKRYFRIKDNYEVEKMDRDDAVVFSYNTKSQGYWKRDMEQQNSKTHDA